MKYAWAENDTIRDICHGNPQELYTPEVAAYYTAEVGDDIVNGATWDGSKWVNPPAPPAPPAPVPQYRTTLTAMEFKMLFTVQERVAIKSARATDPYVEDFWSMVEDPRLQEVILTLQPNIDAIHYLVSKSLLTVGRGEEILRGMPV